MQVHMIRSSLETECTVQVHPSTVATDGLFLNIYAVLLRFAEPFMDSTYSKASFPGTR